MQNIKTIRNILFVNNEIKDLNLFIKSVNEETMSIIYDENNLEEILKKLTNIFYKKNKSHCFCF